MEENQNINKIINTKMSAPVALVRSPTTFLFYSFLRKKYACLSQLRLSSSNSLKNTRDDPFPVFCEPKNQALLQKITGFDMVKVAGPSLKPLRKPTYKLLTDEQLAEETHQAETRLKKKLQFPPYMKPRVPPSEPLQVDPELEHFDTCKWVFTDVTFGVPDRDRVVTIRETDGTLHLAPWDVRERMSQIYNPRPGRHMVVPAMFNEEYLEPMIKRKEYRYILDRACAQFEPDDPQYIRVTHRVYNAVNSEKDYDILWSLRHFGPLTFYLVWHDMIENLLAHLWDNNKRADAEALVRLYASVHPASACASHLAHLSEPGEQEVVEAFVSSHKKTKTNLEWKNRGLVNKSIK